VLLIHAKGGNVKIFSSGHISVNAREKKMPGQFLKTPQSS